MRKTINPTGLWFLFYITTILTLSFFGSKSFGGNNLLKSPYDLIAVVLAAVLFYFAAINTSIKKEEMEMIIEEEFIGEEFEI